MLLCVLVAAAILLSAVADRPATPDAVWVHPGDPWCAACTQGVPCYGFRLAPEGPEFDPGWCFNAPNRGLELGPPDTALSEFVTDIERDFNGGERSYSGGVRYERSGRTADDAGHHWTEYRRCVPR